MAISLVIPLRDPVSVIAPLLAQLQPLRGADFEIIVVEAEPPLVDSVATLDTGARLRDEVDQWLMSAPGRATQLQLGAQAATHSLLWFLHADSIDIDAAARWLQDRGVEADKASDLGVWGRFDVGFDDSSPLLRCVAWLMNSRSRLTRVFTGDQGIWVSARLLVRAGGWPQQPLMEDVELSKRLRVLVEPLLNDTPALTTSARRWRRDGTLRTILLMWWLRLRYAWGADPQDLHGLYYREGYAPVREAGRDGAK